MPCTCDACQAEITSLRAELEIWRRNGGDLLQQTEITTLRAELAERTLMIDELSDALTAARHDTEAIARLKAALEPFAKLNVTRFMTDGCRYEFRIDAAWIRGARAALARRRP